MKILDQNPVTARQETLALGKITRSDIKIIYRCKNEANRLGFGYQLVFVRIRNYFPKQKTMEIDTDILQYIAQQLNLPMELIKGYRRRRSVISAHQSKIKKHLLLKEFTDTSKKKLMTYLLKQAYQTDQISLLVPKAQCFLKDNLVLQPALSKLRRIAGECRSKAKTDIEERLVNKLSKKVKENLENMLKLNKDRSFLWQLKRAPGIPSADNIKELITKLKNIEELEILDLDIGWLNHNYQQRLAKYARNYSAARIDNLPKTRNTVLAPTA